MSNTKYINWDAVWVHGENPDTKYIRYNENQHALKTIAPVFVEAVEKRRSLFTKRISLMQEIIRLAEQVIVLQRAVIAKQRGALPITKKIICH